jgi:hypothetical protein
MTNESFRAVGVYTFSQERDGVVIDTWTHKNILPLEGRNYVLDSALSGVSASSSWFIGIYQGNYTPVAGDTAATFSSSATECTSYVEAARQPWVKSAASAALTSNAASKANFTFNATVSVYGAFVSSASAKNATTGTLLSAARLSEVKSMASGDVLTVTYALSLAS